MSESRPNGVGASRPHSISRRILKARWLAKQAVEAGDGASAAIEAQTRQALAGLLEHIRFIHFSILLVCATVLYLVGASWSERYDAVKEVERFAAFVRQLQAPQFADGPNADNYFRDFKRNSLNIYQGTVDGVVGDFISVKNLDSLVEVKGTNVTVPSDLETLRVGDICRLVDGDTWTFAVPGNMVLRSIDEQKRFVARVDAIRQHDGHVSFLGQLVAVSDPTVLARLDASPPVRVVRLDIQADFYALSTQGRVPLGDDQVSVYFTYVPEDRSVSLAPDWLETHFAFLSQHLSTIRAMSLGEARAWAREQRLSGMRFKNPTLLGIEVRGEHLGIVAPLVIVSLFLYLGAYVLHARHLARVASIPSATVERTSPWIGTMSNRMAQVTTVVTLAGLPFLSVLLPVYQFYGDTLAWFLFGFLLSIAIAVAGVWLTVIAQSVEARPAGSEPGVNAP